MNYQQLECDYFNLYNQFISVDFQISLFEKNHKSLIKDFIFFYHQILKQKDLNFLLGVRNKIALKVHNYMQEYSTSPKDLSLICLREHKHIEFFQRFYKALAYFVAFRKKLDEEQKIKNLISNIPEKCLQYFHLAMIHLCFMVLNPLNFKDSNRHLDKAINYLIDGAFEIYELIFKEYFLLFPKDEELKDELKKIKNLEFKILMQEVSRVKLLNHYKEFCEEIFYNIELEKII
ncbi:hypothetical protein LRV55_000796 [Campylobacter coli]|nr:hypothetical protein [Campylobacter coli]EIQ3336318.1 hypothetical protein [Campylobacter coli]